MEEEQKKSTGEDTQLLESAALKIEQELYDAADPEARLVVTVHKISKGSAANVWYKPTQGEPHRIIPERLLSGEPDPYIILGEVMRLAEAKENELKGDLRLKLGILGLQGAAVQLAKSQGLIA